MSDPAEDANLAGAASEDVRPTVKLPSSGLPVPIVMGGFAVLAVGLFLLLEGRRHAPPPRVLSVANSEASPIAPPPPLQIPQSEPTPVPIAPPPAPPPPPQIRYIERPPPPPAAPVIRYIPRPIASQPSPQPAGPSKALEPALVLDLADAPAATTGPQDSPAHANLLHNRSYLIPEGALIPAVLETPIESTRPGPVRAITSSDTHGFDGTKVLIPRGSRLIGDFHTDVQQGQTRVLVTWDRLVRPDGVMIHLTSPASDAIGGIGIAGDVNNHLLARISNVFLQSAFTAGTNLASNPGSGSVVIGATGTQAFANSSQTLLPSANLKPTITVKEGVIVTVFVTKDLDFGGISGR